MSASSTSSKSRAADLHFVLQSATNLELYFLKGDDEAFLDQYSFSTIVQIQPDTMLSLVIRPFNELSEFRVLHIGTEEESAQFKENLRPPVDTNSSNSVPMAMFLATQQHHEAKIAELTERNVMLDTRVRRLEEQLQKKKNTSYVKKTDNDIGTLTVNIDGKVTLLSEHMHDTSALTNYLIKTKRYSFEITDKYQLPIRNKLRYLRNYIQDNFDHPDRCGYAIMLELLPLEEFAQGFLPSDKHQVRTRAGMQRTKIVLNTSLQALFRSIMMWSGVRVFTQKSQNAWHQLAVDGVNSRVDQFNCKKKQRHSMKPSSGPVWKCLADCQDWHQNLTRGLPEPEEEEAQSSEDEANPGSLDVHNFDTLM